MPSQTAAKWCHCPSVMFLEPFGSSLPAAAPRMVNVSVLSPPCRRTCQPMPSSPRFETNPFQVLGKPLDQNATEKAQEMPLSKVVKYPASAEALLLTMTPTEPSVTLAVKSSELPEKPAGTSAE